MPCNSTKLNDFYRGDTVPIKITISQNSIPVDITASNIKLTLKKSKNDPDPGALQKTAVLTNPTAGEALIELASADTDIEPRQYYYDIQWTNSSGDIRTLMSGVVSVLRDITLT